MIRLIQRRLIIPRGDTGSFSIPVLKNSTDNIAVFTIFDEQTHKKIFQKLISSEGDILDIAFTHNETVNLKPGKYNWDIKYYSNPVFIDEELVGGEEVDSYYAGFSLPICEIRETADNYLVSPDAPNATLSPAQLDIISGALHNLNEAIQKTQKNVEHYPKIENGNWYVWDINQENYIDTNIHAFGQPGNSILSITKTNTNNLVDTYTITFTDNTTTTFTVTNGAQGPSGTNYVLTTQDKMDIANLVLSELSVATGVNF